MASAAGVSRRSVTPPPKRRRGQDPPSPPKQYLRSKRLRSHKEDGTMQDKLLAVQHMLEELTGDTAACESVRRGLMAAAAGLGAMLDGDEGHRPTHTSVDHDISCEDTLDLYQLEAYNVIQEGKNLFMTGEAGTGKSYLVEHLRKTLPGNVSVCAPNWKAAVRIGGTSLHFFAGVNVGKLEVSALAALQFIKMRSRCADIMCRWQKCDVLLIDEVSMLHPVVLDSLEELARLIRKSNEPFGGIRLVLCGDFLQIPPVKGAGRFCFQAACWSKLFPEPRQMRTLQGVHRQEGDADYHMFLRRLRYGFLDLAKDAPFLLRCSKSRSASALQIFATNKSVNQENDRKLHDLPGDMHEFSAIDTFEEGIKEFTSREIKEALDGDCPQLVRLKVGAPVVLTHVQNTATWYRGLEGKVVRFDPDGDPVVRFMTGLERAVCRTSRSIRVVESQRVLATRSQIPLALGWAVTLHKAQGLSLDAASVQVSDAFEPGMGYVAMSRVRSAQGLQILDELNGMTLVQFKHWAVRKLCRVDKSALNFHLQTLDVKERDMIKEERAKFALLTSADWAAVRQSWGSGVTLPDRRPSWAITTFGDHCYRCGQQGHWQADCLTV